MKVKGKKGETVKEKALENWWRNSESEREKGETVKEDALETWWRNSGRVSGVGCPQC